MFEAAPGLFYVLSTEIQSTFGASVFTITTAGTFKLVYSLPPYAMSYALVQATNGKLYGPAGFTQSPNYVYFSLAPSGKNYQQYVFPGNWSSLNLTIAAPPGQLYDLVASSSPPGSTAFGFARTDESGTISILHQFSGTEGAPNPYANLAYGTDGNVYAVGNQTFGGISPGFIYRFTPKGAYSQVLSFRSFPSGGLAVPLTAASDGNLYGSFGAGGANHTGEIYQATLSGQLQTVATFPAKGMTQPLTLMQAGDGNIYGTTNNSYIFRYHLATHALTTVYQLTGPQGNCACQLIEGMDGKLYGVTPNGGTYPGVGAVFSLDIGLPKPTPVVTGLYPASGRAGQKVVLWGNYLLGATTVTFNGAPATRVVSTSVQSVLTTVPAGATTGPVTVTTANGSFTTTQNFTVQ